MPVSDNRVTFTCPLCPSPLHGVKDGDNLTAHLTGAHTADEVSAVLNSIRDAERNAR